jgi:hypothetical protein
LQQFQKSAAFLGFAPASSNCWTRGGVAVLHRDVQRRPGVHGPARDRAADEKRPEEGPREREEGQNEPPGYQLHGVRVGAALQQLANAVPITGADRGEELGITPRGVPSIEAAHAPRRPLGPGEPVLPREVLGPPLRNQVVGEPGVGILLDREAATVVDCVYLASLVV